jgi:DNA (cytosine-5)-methyltransferase 1
MRRGFEQIGARCVFTSEWDEKAQETYRANFGHEHIAGDIREIDAGDIPEHDVLLAGFPCQPFSLAGISKKNSLGRAHGFDCETQGTLFFEIQRILAARRPKAFLLENVKNLRGHDKGQTFAVIEQVLTEELGYHVQTRVIDACSFVPQHRERVFIVGFRDETDFDFETLSLPDPADGPRLSSILHSQARDEPSEPPYTIGAKARVNPKYTLTDNLWKYLQAYKAKHQAAGNGFGYGLVTGKDVSRTLSARYHKDGAEILIKRRADPPRRLTPRECARLMGFDYPGEPHWRIPVSDTQAYRQFGNAVVPQVVAAVARHMAVHLKPEAGIADRISISDLRVNGAGAALNS